MNKWSLHQLTGAVGRHLLSEEHIRIQVLQVDAVPRDLWRLPRGAVLVIVLSGACQLFTEDGGPIHLSLSDQVVLFAGEAFAFQSYSATELATLQFVWVPGISGPLMRPDPV